MFLAQKPTMRFNVDHQPSLDLMFQNLHSYNLVDCRWISSINPIYCKRNILVDLFFTIVTRFTLCSMNAWHTAALKVVHLACTGPVVAWAGMA